MLLAYFDPKKYTLRPKLTVFLNFMHLYLVKHLHYSPKAAIEAEAGEELTT